MDNIPKSLTQQGLQECQAAPQHNLSFHIGNNGVELLKWLALIAMVVDHVNAVFYGRDLGPVADAIGRVAMPVFALVLAYNLARPSADLLRCLRRLALFGLLALPVHGYLFGVLNNWWPLNILWTFAVAVGCIELGRRNLAVAVVVFLLGGALVEYWWPGVALVIAAWIHFRRPSVPTAVALVVSLLGLCLVNGNAWALLALPVIALASGAAVPVPRLRSFFWWFYPLHLVALAAIALVPVPSM